ncbi:putative calcium/sodium:proton antiporter [Crateriforma conspicua]|nr:putative calcium/sodium:proton antiporter [Crateriforma conspicua]
MTARLLQPTKGMFEFQQLSIPTNVVIFFVAACVVWLAGTKLSRYVDLFAERTGVGEAFAGAMLLGGATSLPELATTVTAGWSGAATLAGSNLLGGIVMQIAVLAFIDAFVLRGKPLTMFSPRSSLLLVGIVLIAMIALACAAIASGDRYVWQGIGIWPPLLFVAYVASMAVIYRYEGSPRWEPRGEVAQPPESAKDLKDSFHEAFDNVSTKTIIGLFCMSGLAVLIGGYFVARSGEALANQTGISQGFIGATLVAVATSLPELSTTYSAVRFGAYSMAAANILGTNSLEVALFLPAELAYREGGIMNAVAASSVFLAALGILVTCLYLWGVLERRDKTFLGMGIDSFAVLVVYAIGMTIYSTL